VPKLAKYVARGVLAVDINEKHIIAENSRFEYRFETVVEKALHYKQIAEELQKSTPPQNTMLGLGGEES
jgi:hypothetical protein